MFLINHLICNVYMCHFLIAFVNINYTLDNFKSFLYATVVDSHLFTLIEYG
jgi:hypothetical protein